MSSEEPFDFSHLLSMHGHSVVDVRLVELDNWVFHFESPARIEVVCPWRLLKIDKRNYVGCRILMGAGNHLHDRGAEEPFDAVEAVARALRNKIVTRVDVSKDTGDLTLDFTENLRLEIILFALNDWAWNLTTLDNQEITWEWNALLGHTRDKPA